VSARRWLAPWLFVATVAAQADPTPLLDRLAGDDPGARFDAFRQLQNDRSGKLVPLLVARLPAMPFDGQRFAMNLLDAQPAEALREPMAKLCRSAAMFVRARAAAWLANHVGPAGDPKIRARAVADFADGLRGCAPVETGDLVHRLHALREEPCFAAARSHLRPGAPPHVVANVLSTLRRCEPQPAAATRAAAAVLVDAEQPGVRAAALACLAETDAARVAPLAALLQAQPELVWSIDDLLEAHPRLAEPLVDALVVALAKPRSKHDLGRIARMVGRDAPDKARTALREHLAGTDADLRAAAVAELATLPGGLDDKDLLQLLADPLAASRLVAAESLRRRDDHAGLPAVIELARQPSGDRLAAVRALGAFRDRRAAPPLLDLLADGNGAVRAAALQGLQQLWPALFPYRRFDFDALGFQPEQQADPAAVATLRAWWAARQ
jgi:HEAT repeat protein